MPAKLTPAGGRTVKSHGITRPRWLFDGNTRAQSSPVEPVFRIVHTPDRPSHSLQAPSEEECREAIRAWHRVATEPGTPSQRSRAAMSEVPRFYQNASTPDRSDSEYEDDLVDDEHDEDNEDDKDDAPRARPGTKSSHGTEARSNVYAPNPVFNRQSAASEQYILPATRWAGPEEKDVLRARPRQSLPPPRPMGERSTSQRTVGFGDRSPSLHPGVGYESDGESYNGEVCEATAEYFVDKDALVKLELYKRGQCPMCKQPYRDTDETICGFCGGDLLSCRYYKGMAQCYVPANLRLDRQGQSGPRTRSVREDEPKRLPKPLPKPPPLLRERAFRQHSTENTTTQGSTADTQERVGRTRYVSREYSAISTQRSSSRGSSLQDTCSSHGDGDKSLDELGEARVMRNTLLALTLREAASEREEVDRAATPEISVTGAGNSRRDRLVHPRPVLSGDTLRRPRFSQCMSDGEYASYVEARNAELLIDIYSEYE